MEEKVSILGTFHYKAFLLSDQSPDSIIFEDISLETLVDNHGGFFINRSFIEILDSNGEEMIGVFKSLFQDFRLNVDVLIIDFDFLKKLQVRINRNQDDLHRYLIGIFFLSIMSSKSSYCKHCKFEKEACKTCECLSWIESPYRRLDVIMISQSKNDVIFPEFLDWLRDGIFKWHTITIHSKFEINLILAKVKDRFLPPLCREARNVIADAILDDA